MSVVQFARHACDAQSRHIFFPESSQQDELSYLTYLREKSCLCSMCYQAELTGRNSGFDLQRELIEGVFIHH